MQQGVLSILSNMLASSLELDEYIKAFKTLDSGQDGTISILEMKNCLK